MLNLKAQMEKGAISAGMVEEAFRLATSEGGRYNGMAEDMAETFGGKLSTFMGTVAKVAGIVGEKLGTWLKPMVQIGINVAENIIPFLITIREIYQWISQSTPLLVFLGGVVLALGVNFAIANTSMLLFNIQFYAYTAAVWLATAATAAFNFVMSMNPISLVIIAIAGLIAGVVLLWNKFDWFRGAVMGVWEVLKGLGTVIKDFVIARFKELLSGITGIGAALLAFFQGDWEKAWEIGKKAVKDLSGVNSGKKALEDGKKLAGNFAKGYADGISMVGDTEVIPGVKTDKKPDIVQPRSSMFDSLMETQEEKDKKKNKAKGDTIVSGGSKMTHITVNIGKLQDKIEIHVTNTEKGVRQMGDKVKEELLRAVNSVNQMQTN